MDSINFDWNDIPDQAFEAFQERLALIELLEDETVPKREKRQTKQDYMRLHNKSDRTIRRWQHKYRKKGPQALLFYRPREPSKRINSPELAKKVIALIKEQPLRSVPKLRELLSEDPAFAESVNRISNRTLYRFLDENNLNRQQRRQLAGTFTKRAYHQFEAPRSLALIQGDARDGIWIPGPNGKSIKTYLFLWIDDYSRKILFGKYYLRERLPCMEDSFKHCILRYGIPDKAYLDNGRVYISKQFAFVLHELKIKKIHHPPYQAWCKGKIEVTNRVTKYDFQSEAQLAGFQTIEELNTAFWAWAELKYNKRVNSTTGEAPDDRFMKGLRNDQRRVEDVAWFQELFLVRDTRTISKYGKIKLYGNQYPVTAQPCRTVVGVRFDPCDLREIYIFNQQHKKFLEKTTTTKQVSIEAPEIPEEQQYSQKQVSHDSQRYFARLREAYLKQQNDPKQIDFTQFYCDKEKNNHE